MGPWFKVVFVPLFIVATGLLTHTLLTHIINSGWVNVATAYKHK